MHTIHKGGKSNWITFLEDVGDCIGGIVVGYGLRPLQLEFIILGSLMILGSFYLKHYHKAK